MNVRAALRRIAGLRRGAALAALGCCAASFAAVEPCTEVAALAPAHGGDDLTVSREAGACVITVEHRRGIGAARIGAPAEALVLRFSGFPELESLSLVSPTTALRCELERAEAAPSAHRCRLDGAFVQGPARTPGAIEFRVPAAFAPSPGEPLELRWVDHWR